MDAALVIMAAGLGSRYGGEKQVDGYGPSGETIMEYSAYDAIRAGFTKIVFITKRNMRETVRSLCGDYLSRLLTRDGRQVAVEYVVQDFDSVPAFYSIPPEREKPFGTVHAALCAKGAVREPFALINADDYYGSEAYVTILDALCSLQTRGEALMVGYLLKNTVSDYGTVTRGICLQENGLLRTLRETYNIKKYPGGRICDASIPDNEIPLDPDTVVSMNFWGFAPWIFEEMERYFHQFLKSLPPDELRAECLLPSLVDMLIKREGLRVPVLSSGAKWFGVTYREDRPVVTEALRRLHEDGVYPETLRNP